MATKIEIIESELISIPLPQPIKHPFLGFRTKHITLILRIRTSDGVEGFGYLMTESERQMIGLSHIVEELGQKIVGMNPMHRGAINDRLWGLTAELMHEGASNMAIAAIDIALWDIFGKQTNLPLSELLGSRRDSVPIYASHGLYRNATLPQLEADAQRIVGEGFKAMKIRFIGQSLKEDVAKAKLVREIVGPDIEIMSDGLWSMTPAYATRLSMELAQYHLTWLEDPIAEEDFKGLARIRAVEGVPVASGERLTRLPELQKMLDAEAIDHLIIDLLHVGGITNWLKFTTLAETHNIPVSGHVMYELQLPLLAAVKNVGYLEYLTHWNQIYKNPPEMKDGRMIVPSTPGLGLELDQAVLRKLAYQG